MRMRRKKNLDSFLTQYPDILFTPTFDEKNILKINESKQYLDLKGIFGSEQAELEIGCGKGSFICELARRNPDCAYLAVEVSKNVIVEACRKVREAGLKNVYFLNCQAEVLPALLPENSIKRIYLNFSCPYPKFTYALHRLTNKRFLDSYRQYLAPGGEIHQKTDNMRFFEYSLEQYSLAGYGIKNVSLDLHNSGFTGNIVTEYEARFSGMGMPIYRVEAYLPPAQPHNT